MSAWQTSMAWLSNHSRNPHRVNSRSPHGDLHVGIGAFQLECGIDRVLVGRFLDEVDVDFPQTLNQAGRCGRGIDAGRIAHQRHVRSRSISHSTVVVDGSSDLLDFIEGLGQWAESGLEGVEPFLFDGLEDVFLQGGLPLGEDVADPGVETDPVPYTPSQQLVYGQAGCLAFEVPKRLIDPAHGAGVHDAHSPPEMAEAQGPDASDFQGVHPQEARAEFRLDLGLDGELAVLGGRLSDSGETLIGADLDEDPVPARSPAVRVWDLHHVCDDVCDFHSTISSAEWQTVISSLGEGLVNASSGPSSVRTVSPECGGKKAAACLFK